MTDDGPVRLPRNPAMPRLESERVTLTDAVRADAVARFGRDDPWVRQFIFGETLPFNFQRAGDPYIDQFGRLRRTSKRDALASQRRAGVRLATLPRDFDANGSPHDSEGAA